MNELENRDRPKWEFLRDAPQRDAQTQEIRSLAAQVALLADRTPTPHWSRAHLCHALARDCISYQTDVTRVGREQIDGFTDPQGPADAALTRGVDDCDAKARLFVALCIACQIPAEMRPMPTEAALALGMPLSHVYARVWLPRRLVTKGRVTESPTDFAWEPAETILSRAVIGCDPMLTPRECAGPRQGGWLYP